MYSKSLRSEAAHRSDFEQWTIRPPTSAYVGGLILILCFNHNSSSLVIRTNSFMLYIIKFHMPGLDNIEEPITTFA